MKKKYFKGPRPISLARNNPLAWTALNVNSNTKSKEHITARASCETLKINLNSQMFSSVKIYFSKEVKFLYLREL